MTPTSSIKEINIALTTRLLLDKLCKYSDTRDSFSKEELVSKTAYAANEMLRDMGCSEIWARKRGSRVFLMHETYHRIVCEVGILADEDANGLYRQPKIVLVNLRGVIPDNATFASLIEAVANLGVRGFKRKENYGK